MIRGERHAGGAPYGCVTHGPGRILRVEALLFLVGLLYVYGRVGGNWAIFAVFVLAPDLLMLGYMMNSRVGAWLYNSSHSYIGPCIALALTLRYPAVAVVAIIWAAHIALDRALGYGLKYDDAFTHTHLGLIGKRIDGPSQQ